MFGDYRKIQIFTYSLVNNDLLAKCVAKFPFLDIYDLASARAQYIGAIYKRIVHWLSLFVHCQRICRNFFTDCGFNIPQYILLLKSVCTLIFLCHASKRDEILWIFIHPKFTTERLANTAALLQPSTAGLFVSLC